MSGYNGRRAPNLSQFLEDLNTIPSPFEQAVQQQQQQQESFNLDEELAMFTNAEFLDFDNLDMNIPLYDPEDSQNHGDKAGVGKEQDVKYMDLLNADFNLPDFTQTDFNASDSQMMHMQAPPFPALPSHNKPAANITSPTDHATPISAPTPQPQTAVSTPAPSRTAGTKRKQSTQHDGPRSLEEASRAAAEEDKRRRNTAASARFRIKKKQREQALERTVKEATEKNLALEARVQELERENKWLKDLITEKNGGTAAEAEEHGSELALMFKKFLASQKSGSEKVSTVKPVNDVSASA
ncbi:transcriptional regulator family: bZIP [Paecilomyces variotii]|nr:transcriptional regulator family: bZIP [Paecilomyces variotii]KAJ9229077.1 transcriptional regulator family: bZIP [Paecilomyces variotii]KAJ9247481.1 transcriptional regulator family: bZIP [Paecilomyces variotii]KAJ9363023.1 transcriptional regulator family: bZIP [Paecilomyces variotii]KAJ9408477.1 transcriptional regulator family: bZIP [Paecilomyces variotii]